MQNGNKKRSELCTKTESKIRRGGGRLNSPKISVSQKFLSLRGSVATAAISKNNTPQGCHCEPRKGCGNLFNLQLFAEKEDTKKPKTKRLTLLISLLLALVLAIVSIPVVAIINKNNANAIKSSDTSTAMPVIGEIFQNESFSNANMEKFMSYISSDGTLSGLASSATATDIRNYAYGSKTSGKAVIVTLGGLQWQVVYLTKDTDGNNVATLLLRDPTDTDQWQTWSNASVGSTPSNMYGTSYMRAVVLNNGGYYVADKSGTRQIVTKKETVAKNKYAPFTVDSFGLTTYIVTPSKISYQLNSQGTPITRNSIAYSLNNESINFGCTYSDYDYSGKIGYANWQNDTVWLPSLSEEGEGNSNQGIWKLSVAERATSSSKEVWLRSYYHNSSFYVPTMSVSGSGGFSGVYVTEYRAVRPALHLNLKFAVLSTAHQVSVSASESESSHGSVSLLGAYSGNLFETGTSATITATPQVGYGFDYWLVNSTKITANPYVFTVNEDITAVAYFKLAYNANITSPNTTLNITSFREDNNMATYFITPTTANLYIYSIQVGTNDAQVLKSRRGLLDYSGASAYIQYTVNEDNRQLTLEIFNLQGDIDIKLNYVNTSPNLPNASGGGVNGAVVTATEGGEARIVGNDIANGADSDTVTYVAVAYKDYIFQGWAYADDLSTFISTNASMRLSKEQANGKVVTAVFVLASTIQGNINSETDNSTDFWE